VAGAVALGLAALTGLRWLGLFTLEGDRLFVAALVGSAAWLADGFWPRGGGEPAGNRTGVTEYPRRADWWHGTSFNVLTGDGAVNCVSDDGTVAAHSPPATGAPPPGGGPFNAYHSEAVWQYFDQKLGK